MKSLTKINGANHASGYKSAAKFAQGPPGEDGGQGEIEGVGRPAPLSPPTIPL
jgi:hypothetical protein